MMQLHKYKHTCSKQTNQHTCMEHVYVQYVCVYIYICIYICICYTHTYIHTFIRTSTHACINAHREDKKRRREGEDSEAAHKHPHQHPPTHTDRRVSAPDRPRSKNGFFLSSLSAKCPRSHDPPRTTLNPEPNLEILKA